MDVGIEERFGAERRACWQDGAGEGRLYTHISSVFKHALLDLTVDEGLRLDWVA